MTPTPTPETPLLASTADGLLPVAAGLALYYFVLTFMHHFVLQGHIRTIMEACAAVSCGLLAVTTWLMHRNPSLQHTPRWAVWMASIVIANALLHLQLSGDPKQTTNIVLILMTIGGLVHSRRHAVRLIVATLVGWIVVVLNAPPDPAWLHFGIAVATATGFAAVLHVTRSRTVLRLAEAEAAVRRAALTDDLTGLLNRRGFTNVGNALIQAARRAGSPVAVLYLDVDGLKAVNDRDGHAAGDRLIRRTSATLSDTLRGADAVGRLGGDEFAVILTATGPLELSPLLERLHAGFAAAGMSVSTGVAHLDQGPATDSLEDLLLRADTDMYRMKLARSGRSEAKPPESVSPAFRRSGSTR